MEKQLDLYTEQQPREVGSGYGGVDFLDFLVLSSV